MILRTQREGMTDLRLTLYADFVAELNEYGVSKSRYVDVSHNPEVMKAFATTLYYMKPDGPFQKSLKKKIQQISVKSLYKQ